MIPTALAERRTPPEAVLSGTSVPKDFGLELFGQPTPAGNALYVSFRMIDQRLARTRLEVHVTISCPLTGERKTSLASIDAAHDEIFVSFDIGHDAMLEYEAFPSVESLQFSVEISSTPPVSTPTRSNP